ncbi:hypothetical protein [Pseudomonas sp. NPDC096950]|uniref:hypothetical protein n=1 Tax=Pseudomonas sp. NPDC096950 TaxID=3364485 RepID=UPI00383B0014
MLGHDRSTATNTAQFVKPRLNTAQRNQLITKAILDAITAGHGEWVTGIVPAVRKLNVAKSTDGLKVRNCLQALIDKGVIYRVWFTDAGELYDLTANKVNPVAPAGGFTIMDGLYKGQLVNLICAAEGAVFDDDEKLPESVTCKITDIQVFLKVENGRTVVALKDGTNVTELFNRALDKAVGMG